MARKLKWGVYKGDVAGSWEYLILKRSQEDAAIKIARAKNKKLEEDFTYYYYIKPVR